MSEKQRKITNWLQRLAVAEHGMLLLKEEISAIQSRAAQMGLPEGDTLKDAVRHLEVVDSSLVRATDAVNRTSETPDSIL